MTDQNIQKYLEGKTTDIESEQILDWLKDPVNENESRRILGEIWFKNEISLKGVKPDFNQLLNQIHHQINNQQSLSQINKRKSSNRIADFYSLFSKVAAILIVPLILFSLYFYFNPKQNFNQLSSISMREICTKPGTRTKIDLPDGTVVWLNDGTTLRYPEKFVGKSREVYLDGEAYFEVKSDPLNPFIVNNPIMNTEVTGTHFNINAYVEDQFFEATLLEGKVSLDRNNERTIMIPGEQVQYDVQKDLRIQKNVNPEDAAAWIKGKLIFKDEKLETAIKKLSRWYNIKIILSDQSLNKYLLTGTIQDEKLNQTLNLISLALPVQYKYKKENNPSDIQRTVYIMKR
jgi:ferric-dicitrate binding protein FerR (iron transport regulator)